MSNSLYLKTSTIEVQKDGFILPKTLPEDVYVLAYLHSELIFKRGKLPIKASELYEAWAFDGKKSWHIWKREGSWVCTSYDSEKLDKAFIVEREQLLMPQFIDRLKKDTLVIHHCLAFDEDDQAYIEYSCPIDLRKEMSYDK